MHAWIFRHRRRLSAVFGMVVQEAYDSAPDEREASREDGPEVARTTGSGQRNRRLGIPPGCVARRERYVVLAPMTPPRG